MRPFVALLVIFAIGMSSAIDVRSRSHDANWEKTSLQPDYVGEPSTREAPALGAELERQVRAHEKDLISRARASKEPRVDLKATIGGAPANIFLRTAEDVERERQRKSDEIQAMVEAYEGAYRQSIAQVTDRARASGGAGAAAEAEAEAVAGLVDVPTAPVFQEARARLVSAASDGQRSLADAEASLYGYSNLAELADKQARTVLGSAGTGAGSAGSAAASAATTASLLASTAYAKTSTFKSAPPLPWKKGANEPWCYDTCAKPKAHFTLVNKPPFPLPLDGDAAHARVNFGDVYAHKPMKKLYKDFDVRKKNIPASMTRRKKLHCYTCTSYNDLGQIATASTRMLAAFASSSYGDSATNAAVAGLKAQNQLAVAVDRRLPTTVLSAGGGKVPSSSGSGGGPQPPPSKVSPFKMCVNEPNDKFATVLAHAVQPFFATLVKCVKTS